MSADWWRGYTPTEARVECGGATHRVRWAAGALHAPDHEDAEGERALHALGGAECACVAVLDGWNRHQADLRVLVLATRGVSDSIATHDGEEGGLFAVRGSQRASARRSALVRARMMAARRQSFGSSAAGVARLQMATGAVSGTQGWFGYAPAAFEDDEPRYDIRALLRLGGGVGNRLVANVAAHWSDVIERDGDEIAGNGAALYAALYGRVTCTLREWIGDQRVNVELDMVEPGMQTALVELDDRLHVSLPFRWIVDVWARGVAVVAGRFALATVAVTDEATTLLTVAGPGEQPRPMTIALG